MLRCSCLHHLVARFLNLRLNASALDARWRRLVRVLHLYVIRRPTYLSPFRFENGKFSGVLVLKAAQVQTALVQVFNHRLQQLRVVANLLVVRCLRAHRTKVENV